LKKARSTNQYKVISAKITRLHNWQMATFGRILSRQTMADLDRERFVKLKSERSPSALTKRRHADVEFKEDVTVVCAATTSSTAAKSSPSAAASSASSQPIPLPRSNDAFASQRMQQRAAAPESMNIDPSPAARSMDFNTRKIWKRL